MSSIAYELLVDLAEGRLSADDATALRAQVAADPTAQAELAAIERLVGLMRGDTSVDTPAHVINRALRLVRRAEAPTLPPALRRLIATLRSDSWRMPLAGAGLRTSQTWPRALLLNAGDRELDLQISPYGNLWRLQGQILGAEEAGHVGLNGGERHISAALNEHGEFTLPPVSPGRYTLIITQGDVEIIVPELELGPSSTPS